MSVDKCELDSFVLEANAAGLKLMDENVDVNLAEWELKDISVNDIGRGPYSRSCSDAEAKGAWPGGVGDAVDT